jgi:hypothetical protein
MYVHHSIEAVRDRQAPRSIRYANAGDIAAKQRAEKEAQQLGTTAARLKSLAANKANLKQRLKVVLPAIIKGAVFYWPNALDWDCIPERLRWYAAYFINLVRCRYFWYRADDDDFSHLHYRLLIKVIPPKELIEVKQLLIDELKVVECDMTCVKGTKALGYKLAPGYWQTHKLVCTDAAINRSIARMQVNRQRDWQPVHRWLHSKLSLLHFDLKAAEKVIAKMKRPSATVSALEHRRNRLDYCKLLAGEDWPLTPCPYGRVHTPLTSLERELRPCLTVNGERLVGWDVVNCQPLLLAYTAKRFLRTSLFAKQRLLDRKFAEAVDPYHATAIWLSAGLAGDSAICDSARPVFANFSEDNPTTGGGKLAGIGKSRGKTEDKIGGKSAGSTKPPNHPTPHTPQSSRIKRMKRNCPSLQTKESTGLRENLENCGLINAQISQIDAQTAIPDDLKAMIAACENGTFYETLMVPEELARGPAYRRSFKQRFWFVLFGPNKTKSKYPNAIRDRLRETYPTAAKMLHDLKARNYKHSSHLLQNLEATIVIHGVCRRIMKECHSMPLYTIHDAVLTTPPYAGRLRTIMMEEFNKWGMQPKLKECNW